MNKSNKPKSKPTFEELEKQNIQLRNKFNKIENELKKVQEIVHIGTWYLDLATNEVEWTEELFKMYGFDPTLPVPPYTEHMKLFTEESWELLSKSLANTAETGIPYELELKTVRKDKSNGWMWVRGETVTDAEGKIIGLWGAAQDITEKKKSEVLLSDSEGKYRALYENAPLSYQSLDIDGNFIDVNPTWLSTLGYKREEVIGKNYGDFLHPEWKSHFETNFPEFKKRGYVSDVQFKIRHKKGHYIDISFEGCIGTNPDGSFKQTYCVFKDITENKQIEEALNKNQFYLSKAQEMGKIGTWELDIINNQLIWTKENYKNFGLKYGTPLTYEIFLNCVHPDDRDYVNQEWKAAMEGKPHDIEYRVIEDGKVKWLREKADVKFDENGNAVSAIGFTQDITELKESEQNLKESEKQYKILFENIIDEIHYWKVIKDKNGEIITWELVDANPSALKAWKKSKEQVIGKTANEIFNYDVQKLFMPIVKKIFKTGKPYSWEAFFPPTEQYLSMDSIPLGEFFISTGRDITIRKKKEQELIKAKERAEENELKLKQSDRVFNLTLDMFCIAGYDGYFKYLNPAWERTLGWSIEELLSKPWLDFVHPDDAENTENIKTVIVDGKEIYKFENRYICKDGSTKWFSWNSQPFPKENIMIGAVRDITETKKIENELLQAKEKAEESEKRYRTLLENLPVGVFRSHSSGKVISANIAMAEMYGYDSFEELLNIPAQNYYTEVNPREKMLAELKKDGVLIDYQTIENKKDGSPIWISANYRMIKTENIGDDKDFYIDGVLIDITGRKQAESKLIRNESIQLKMLSNIGDVIVIIDENGINRYKSPNVKNQFGWEVDELVGKSAWGKVHPDYIESAKELLSDLVHEPKKTITTELLYLRKDGEYRWIEITISNLLNDPEINGFLGNYHDITERKLDEEALCSSQEMLVSSQSLANICSYSTNLIETEIDKSHWECSPEFYKIFGIDETYPHTIEGWIGFLHPDYREDVVAYHESVVLEKKSFNREYKIIRINDGAERWVHGTGELVYDKNGNPIRMHGAIQDITERKQAELALKESEWYLEKAQGVSKTGHYIWDLRKSSLTWSDEMFNICGVKQENGTPSPEEYINFVHEDDKHILSPEHMEIIFQKPNHELQFKIIDQSTNDVKHIYLWGETILNNTGEPVRVIGVIQDITKQKETEFKLSQAKEKAEESEKQLRHISDNFVNGMIYQVAMLDENHRQFNYVSKNVEELYGCTVEEAKKDANLIYGKIHPDDIEGLIEKEKVALKKMSKFETEARTIAPNGNIRWAYYISKPRMINGVVCWDGIEIDITERKQIELELIKAKEKAEHSERLKSAFLANMSHEIRTPMNGILGFTALLQDTNLSVENHKEYIDIIDKSGNRLLNTVNDIIEISKIESGEINVTKSEVDIIGHLNTLVTFFRPEAKKKNINVIVQNNIDGNDLTITIDKNKLSSILSNLIKNAIKYTNEGTINVGLKIENDQILFSCQDTGIGIPKSRQEAIFNRFEQADIEDKQVHEGSGLGLAIVKSYVEMLDGKIWVESEEGEGSTFYVSLPFEHEKKKEQNIPKEVKSSDSGIKNINVLIVEDEEFSSMHLSIILKDKVKNISIAQNGIEAVDACKNDSGIDLILMDIKMPVMSGIEATKKIREFNSDVVIIAQTAYALGGDRGKALDAGCNDYISKPIIKAELLSLIQKYFENN